jgi:hypothetical protein
MRIWIPNTDPDPLTQLYPDPEHWFRIHNSLNSGPGSLVPRIRIQTQVLKTKNSNFLIETSLGHYRM